MRFEWDTRKDLLNRAKHDGIDFEAASRVFADPLCLYRVDRNLEGEARWHAIGFAQLTPSLRVVLVVVPIYRESINGEETIRIISARRARKHDIRRYQEQETN